MLVTLLSVLPSCMKRTRNFLPSSPICESAEDDGISIPLPSKGFHTANTNTPLILDSFSILVRDTQDNVVIFLDCGTKQSLALTCKEMHARYYDTTLTTIPFSELLPNAPIFYLKNCIKLTFNIAYNSRNQYSIHHGQLQRIAAIMAERWDIVELLEWFINLYCYNCVERIVTYTKLYSVLVKAFLTTGNVKGLQWMITQSWYKAHTAFPENKRHKYQKLLATSGNIALLDFVMSNSTLIFQLGENFPPEVLSDLVITNMQCAVAIYDWLLLFSSTAQWKAWWFEWRNDASSNGFVGCIEAMNREWLPRNEVAIVDNIYRLWPNLSAYVKERLRHSIRIDPFEINDNRTPFQLQTLLNQFAHMEIEIRHELLQIRLQNNFFFEYISKANTDVVDWLWTMQQQLFQKVARNLKESWIYYIHEWVFKTTPPIVRQAIRWLETHSFDLFQSLADLMRIYLRLR